MDGIQKEAACLHAEIRIRMSTAQSLKNQSYEVAAPLQKKVREKHRAKINKNKTAFWPSVAAL